MMIAGVGAFHAGIEVYGDEFSFGSDGVICESGSVVKFHPAISGVMGPYLKPVGAHFVPHKFWGLLLVHDSHTEFLMCNK